MGRKELGKGRSIMSLIDLILMFLAMACQGAAALKHPAIFELQKAAIGLWSNDREIKVDEVAVVDVVALRAAYAVWIVANPAWGVHAFNVLLMFTEALIVEDAGRAVALEAHVIETLEVGNAVQGIVLALQNERIGRTMWPRRTCTARPGAVVSRMTVGAEDLAGGRQRW